MNHSVVISLASNQDQELHLAEAQRRLALLLQVCKYTAAIWTNPISAKRSSQYLNQLLYAETELSCEQLEQSLKNIETELGRKAEDREHGIICIDLDLMRYDDKRYHVDDWEREYIKKLL